MALGHRILLRIKANLQPDSNELPFSNQDLNERFERQAVALDSNLNAETLYWIPTQRSVSALHLHTLLLPNHETGFELSWNLDASKMQERQQ